MRTEIKPVITNELLDSIEPSPTAGTELLDKQWDAKKAVIILLDDEGSEIERFDYEAEKGMTIREFKMSLMQEAIKLKEAAA